MSGNPPFGRPPPGGATALSAEFASALSAQRAGHSAEAERICQAILLRDPNQFDAALLLGLIFLSSGRTEAAERQIARAASLKPKSAAAHRHHGIALSQLKRFPEALAALDRAIVLKSDLVDTHVDRGNLLQDIGRFEDAVASYDRAIRLKPDLDRAVYNRALALQALGRLPEALAGYDRVLALRPDSADALVNRGNVLKDMGRLDDALASYDRAVARKPDLAGAHYNRAVTLLDLKRAEDAIASYDRAIALMPENPQARFGRGLARLALGRVAEAWDDFENRWRIPAVASPRPAVSAPDWMGESILGKRILVYSERGFGDIIHFCRYLPLLCDRGADVDFLVPRKLHWLMRTLSGRVRLIDAVPADARYDCQCALMSLPARFATDLATIPAHVPYLAAQPSRVSEWKARIGESGFKIGVSWQGASWQGGIAIAGRSFPLSALESVAHVPGVRLISLQKNEGAEQLATLPEGMQVETLGDFDSGADAFADTAAAMECLDLIVSCDTSIAHLAGALARPVWIALKHVPEWRWMLEGERSPWYPSMRLFRQTRPGDWGGVFAAMAAALRVR